jgi:molybdopterin-guanine dinucleotide biosynthesis protein A
MSVAGYVLAGGKSTRMGKDKALLEIDGVPLANRVAQLVQSATGNVTLIGDPLKYAALGLRVIPDRRPGEGPLAGMEAALLDSASEWNLILACDLAALQSPFLSGLCSRTSTLKPEVDCLVPFSDKMQPLSAIYRRRCLAAFSHALDTGVRKVTDVVASLRFEMWKAPSDNVFQNINTPEDWNRYLNGR